MIQSAWVVSIALANLLKSVSSGGKAILVALFGQSIGGFFLFVYCDQILGPIHGIVCSLRNETAKALCGVLPAVRVPTVDFVTFNLPLIEVGSWHSGLACGRQCL